METLGSGPGNRMRCPRCGRTYPETGVIVCPECRVRVVPAAAPPPGGPETAVTLQVSPVLRDALSSARPGEDLDEAILRALKAYHPEQGTALLSALTRLVEIEMERTKETREQVIHRLAEADSGPQVAMRYSGGGPTRVNMESHVIRIGDQEYHSLDEVPPHLRSAIERAKTKGMSARGTPVAGSGPRVSCSWALLGGWLVGLIRALGK